MVKLLVPFTSKAVGSIDSRVFTIMRVHSNWHYAEHCGDPALVAKLIKNFLYTVKWVNFYRGGGQGCVKERKG